jgi:hypothetical protein
VAPQLVHLDLSRSELSRQGVAALAGALASCSALTHLALPCSCACWWSFSTRNAMDASRLVRAVAALPDVRRRAHGGGQGRMGAANSAFHDHSLCWYPGPSLAQLTRLTWLDCGRLSGALVRAAAPGIAALTSLRHLWLCVSLYTPHVVDRVDEEREGAAHTMAQHWPRLTLLTVLDLSSPDGRPSGGWLGRAAAVQLSMRLAPLGPRLLSVAAPRRAQSEAPLKALAFGVWRLDLAAIGIDDSLVDEAACVCAVGCRVLKTNRNQMRVVQRLG